MIRGCVCFVVCTAYNYSVRAFSQFFLSLVSIHHSCKGISTHLNHQCSLILIVYCKPHYRLRDLVFLNGCSLRSMTFNPSDSSNGCSGVLLNDSTVYNSVIHILWHTYATSHSAAWTTTSECFVCSLRQEREREITAKMFSGPQRKRGRVFYWQSHCYYSQMVRGVCEWVKQARSKIKQEWKKQKHAHCERSGWCNECVEIKAKQADTDSVLYSSGEQNSFQPDGGSHWPGYTEDTVHHLSFLTKVCVFGCTVLQHCISINLCSVLLCPISVPANTSCW